MLRVDQVYVIRHKVFVEHKSIREVASQMGVHRKTVRRYLRQPEPTRHEKAARPRPVTEKARQRIDELVAEWGPRTTEKQRITASRLHRQLVEEGQTVGRTVVRECWREIKRQRAEVFVPLVHHAGEDAQIDFFEVVVDIAGERQKAWKFLLRHMHSGRDFAWLYDRQDQIAFLDGHVRAFEHLGGIAQRCVYDNCSVAVRRFAQVGRELTERFAALVNHYNFEPSFARPGEGHDKGGVESRGKHIRLQHLVPIPRGGSLREIAEQLVRDLDKQAAERKDASSKSVLERFEAERPFLRRLPPAPFEARRTEALEVSSKATVLLGGGWYSVPSNWKRLSITAYVGVEDVRFVCRGELVTRPRVRFGGREIRYRDYLSELAKKPQAVRQIAPELTAELGEPFGKLWSVLTESHGGLEAGRLFAKIVGAITKQGEGPVRAALEQALGSAVLSMGAGGAPGKCTAPETVPVPDSLKGYEVEAASARDFDHLLVGGGQ
jgi:transposase